MVSTAATIFFVLLAAIVATTIAYLQADTARRAEAELRVEAEAAGAEARAAAEFLTFDVLALDPNGDAGDENVTILEALDAAAPRIDERLRGQPRAEAAVRHVVGAIYRFHMQYDKARPHLERAVALRRRLFGADHPTTLASSHHLANVLHHQGHLYEAEKLATFVLQCRRERLPPSDTHVASSLALLGLILTDRGNPEKAEPMLRESLRTFEAELPQGHWRVANVRGLLGACLSSQGRYDEAEPLLLTACQDLATPGGAPPQHRLRAFENTSRLYDAWGNEDKALEWRESLGQSEDYNVRVEEP